jgi:DNA (cytosine-5)-methyltransferase 1
LSLETLVAEKVKEALIKIDEGIKVGGGVIAMDYSTLKRPALLALCKERGIKGYSTKNKAELIGLLSSTGDGTLVQVDMADYTKKSVNELKALCKEKGVKRISKLKRDELLKLLQPTVDHVDAEDGEDGEDGKGSDDSIEHIVSTPTITYSLGEPNSFTFIDLFCGIGGFHQAMKSFGGKCVLACDIDAKCRAVYNKNYGIMPHPDVTKLKTEEMPDFDVMCGGFPCQAFSHAGKQSGFDDIRGTLFLDVARILKDKQPKLALLENVKNLKGHDKGRTWTVIHKSLCDAGYITYEQPIIMSPHHLGIPQNRERVIIICVRKDLVASGILPPPPVMSPHPTDITSILVPDNEVPPDVKLTDNDLVILNKWEELVQYFKQKSVKLPTFPIWTADWDKTTSLKDEIDWKAKFIQQNRDFYTEYRDFLAPWTSSARSITGFSGARAKFEWQAGAFHPEDSLWTLLFQYRPSGIRVKRATYSPALVAMGQIVVIGAKKRKLTPREVARLQSFPESFQLPTKSSEAYRQFGNAVNVEVIRYATNHMFSILDPRHSTATLA